MENLSIIKKNYIDCINQIVIHNKISHSYLIEIEDYDNDFSYILSFIKMILCNVTYDKIDSSNSIVSLIDSNNYPDLFILEPDGNTFKKNQLIDLQRDFKNKSLLGGKRVYIIKNAEKFNQASSNSILKFLEEPEEDIIAFLLTDNRFHVLDTILSRCQVLSLIEYKNDYYIDEDVTSLLSYLKNPSDFFVHYNYISNHIFIDKNTFLAQIDNVEKIIISYYYSFYSLNSDVIPDNILSILNGIKKEKLLSIISIIEKEKEVLEYNVNFKLFLDSFYSKIILEVI